MPRSDPRQLDLFRRSEVVAFPADRWVGTMRAVAAELLTIPDYFDRDRRWKEIIGPITDRLHAAGIPPVEVKHQVMAFRTGVLCQARRQVILAAIRDTGGAR